MGEVIKKAIRGNIWFNFLSGFSLLLIGASFIVPPMGVIDGSVLAAVGELFGFGALWCVVKAIDRGVDATVEHNGTKVTIENDRD